MAGQAFPDPTPTWLRPSVVTGRTPGEASPYEPHVWRALRMLAGLIGADDPQSQAMGIATTGLPMGHADRMKRAAEQGFDTSRRLYHGTTNDFTGFNSGRREIYLSDDPSIASGYAENYGRHKGLQNISAGPNVLPVYAKAKKPLVISDLGPDGTNGWSGDNMAAVLGVDNPGTGRGLYDEARKQGYDVVEIRDMSDLGGRQTQVIPLAPNNVRSVFAAFDPSKRDSSDLLASVAAAVVAGSSAKNGGNR